MSVDLSDPNIATAYEDIIKNKGKDWLLLSYGQTRDKLFLHASGEGDILALKDHLSREQDDVYFGFVREVENGKSYYALIAIVSETVSGVRRARALVHSRAVGSLLKAHATTINVSKLEQLSQDIIRERLHLTPSQIPRVVSDSRVLRSVSEPAGHRHSSSLDSTNGIQVPEVVKQAFEAPRTPTKLVTSYSASADMSMRSLPPRRAQAWANDLPPPTPPKDKVDVSPLSISKNTNRQYSHDSFATKRAFSASHTDLPYLADDPNDSMNSPNVRPSARTSSKTVYRGSGDSTRAKSMPRPLSPEERQRMRMLARKKREEDELQAAQEESARMERIRHQKEQMQRDQEREERERLERIRQEKEHALAEKARREREHQQEEERKAREMEEKRQKEKERRALLARKLEEDRERNERRIQENLRKREEERKTSEAKRKAKMKEIQSRFADRFGTRPVLLEGSVTVQTSASISWKRRYFELTANAVQFYRDSQDRGQPLDVMNMSRMRAIREPSEGYDELEAIPHSFAVEFEDDGPWSFFADSADDKDILVSLLSQVAGL